MPLNVVIHSPATLISIRDGRSVAGQRETDQTASMHRHEIDHVRGRHLRGNDQSLLSLFIVDQDKHPSVPRLLDDQLDRRENSNLHVRGARPAC